MLQEKQNLEADRAELQQKYAQKAQQARKLQDMFQLVGITVLASGCPTDAHCCLTFMQILSCGACSIQHFPGPCKLEHPTVSQGLETLADSSAPTSTG